MASVELDAHHSDPEAALHRSAEDYLVGLYGERLGEDEVRQTYERIRSGFDGSPLREFVPLLTYRFAKQALDEMNKDDAINGPDHGAENGIAL